MTRLIKDLEIGDIVRLSDPEGRAVVSRKDRSHLFGGCWAIDLDGLDTHNQGQVLAEQHYPGDMAVELSLN